MKAGVNSWRDLFPELHQSIVEERASFDRKWERVSDGDRTILQERKLRSHRVGNTLAVDDGREISFLRLNNANPDPDADTSSDSSSSASTSESDSDSSDSESNSSDSESNSSGFKLDLDGFESWYSSESDEETSGAGGNRFLALISNNNKKKTKSL